MNVTRIVVGANGSSGSTAAVRWAAVEAQLRGSELRVVIAHPRRPSGHAETAEVLHKAVGAARAVAPGLEVRGVAMPGYAVPVLLHAAEDAVLLVVGEHSGGRMLGAPDDSVGNQVATQARCSVAVVRGRPDCDSGPVVVEVADEPGSDAVIGRAFEEAALHGTEVLAVTAGPDRRGVAAEVLGTEMDSRLDPWRAKFRSVPAQRAYVNGRPDRVMVDSCRQARLAVVGPHRQGYPGALLGAVGTRLLRRADCPVLIVR
ncbi:nucleotide-binding universal stress UspA family protein [Actinoplanes tereljensis]|nr:universal stress protein [Actinoplanes tereljensis]